MPMSTVYRERRREAGAEVVTLTRNYRSQRARAGDCERAVRTGVRRELCGSGSGLVARSQPPAGGRVELLLADKRSFDSGQEHWRAGEVRLVADRIAELVATGSACPGRWCCCSRPGPMRCCTRALCGGAACGRCAPPEAATTPSSRWPTSSATCACCETATTTLPCWACWPRRWSECPTTACWRCGGQRCGGRSSLRSSATSCPRG